jgi:hypothetical protein
MTDTVFIPITRCDKCLYCTSKRVYTGDSWEQVFDWFCTKDSNSVRIGQAEHPDYPPIPSWCPLRSNKP